MTSAIALHAVVVTRPAAALETKCPGVSAREGGARAQRLVGRVRATERRPEHHQRATGREEGERGVVRDLPCENEWQWVRAKWCDSYRHGTTV